MKTIEYKVSFEKMISRLPALFAYLESDDYGVVSLHKATDSLDGCWGKIVENIKLPSGVSLTVEGDEILKSGETYTFRTIIDYYYQYRKDLEDDDIFVKFIEEAIGKIEVEDFEGKTEATPKFIYLACAKSLYNQLVKMDKQCEFYEENLERGLTEKDKHLCCLCERYKQIGGDGFKDWVGQQIPKAETIAEKYKGYAHNEIVIKNCCEKDENDNEICTEITRDRYNELTDSQKLCCKFICPLTLDFDIDLKSTYQDFGILTPYAPIWLPYKRYKVGDRVEYNGELYECKIENTGKWDDDYLTVVFDDTKFEKIDSRFVDIHTEEQEGKIVYTKNYIEKTINSVGEIWYDGEGVKHIAQNRDIGRIVKDYDINLQFPLQVCGTTDTKLVDLRRFVTYYNDDGVAERPESGKDWLFYYRYRNVVNIRTLNDDLGNVLSLSQPQDDYGNKKAATVPTDLMAYGDIIEEIQPIANYKLKFIYRVGVHLKANAAPTIVTDDDGNKLYKWDKFIWDNESKTGIKYEEEYNYEKGSDLDKLIRGEFVLDGVGETFNFNDYIKGVYDKKIPAYKFEFITLSNSFDYNKTIAHQDVNIVSTLTDFEAYRKDFDEFAGYELIKEDYLNGISYKPTKKIDVHIERGSTSVFDKHIAFGEVKTMDDMETYKNGSFFKMSVG